MRVLVTGTAGFIGNEVALRLLHRGDTVVGLDNVNDYYDVTLKERRLERIKGHPQFEEARISLEDREDIEALFSSFRPERVIHLAAQAGVRYSLEQPHRYVDSNLVGFVNILEGCRRIGVDHLVYASSSSVYGANSKTPHSVIDNVDHPLSLYAATKKANELMAHAYSHLYGMRVTGLRFFTVYGPWGRPDMAYFKFTKAILEHQPISIFNRGKLQRDFTYIDDIVDGVLLVLERAPEPNPDWSDAAPNAGTSSAAYRIYNIGNNQPVELEFFIKVIEDQLGITAEKILLPHQPGDMYSTFADIDDLRDEFGFNPSTSLETGIKRFVEWYKSYHVK